MTLPTQAELDVLKRLTAPGSSVKSVARDLGIPAATARSRLHRLYRRLHVNNAVQALAVLGTEHLDT